MAAASSVRQPRPDHLDLNLRSFGAGWNRWQSGVSIRAPPRPPVGRRLLCFRAPSVPAKQRSAFKRGLLRSQMTAAPQSARPNQETVRFPVGVQVPECQLPIVQGVRPQNWQNFSDVRKVLVRQGVLQRPAFERTVGGLKPPSNTAPAGTPRGTLDSTTAWGRYGRLCFQPESAMYCFVL